MARAERASPPEAKIPKGSLSQTRAAGFGAHLVYQDHGRRRSYLSDPDRLHHLLEDPQTIRMTRVMPPSVLRVEHLPERGSDFPRELAGSRALFGEERRHVATALGLEALG